jgi:NADH-quinone oxidoreductase subunit A
MNGLYDGYAVLALAMVVGVGFVVTALVGNALLRPDRPTPEKSTTYECGLDPVGEGWSQVHLRYYVYAYLYVIFAVDAVYLFPWATVFDSPAFGWVTLVEMVVFVGFLAIGILYAWRRNVLRWV